MAHFNFVISQNAKWGHAGFYIDYHRMTVPENILLQKALQVPVPVPVSQVQVQVPVLQFQVPVPVQVPSTTTLHTARITENAANQVRRRQPSV